MRDEHMISEEEYNLYQDELNECRKQEDYKALKQTILDRIAQAHKEVDATFDAEEFKKKANPEPALKNSKRTMKKNTQHTSVDEAVESTQEVINKVNPDEYSKQNNLPFK